MFKSKENDVAGVRLFDTLPLQPQKILVETTNLEFASDIYEVDLKSFLSKRVFRGATGETFFADPKGAIKGKSEFLGGGDDASIEFSYRNPSTDRWEKHHAYYAAEREGMQPAAMDMDGRTIYMIDNTGRDKNVIRTYDLLDRTLSDPIYADASFGATGVLQSEQPEYFGAVIGFTAQGEGSIADFTNDGWASLQQRIEAALPKRQNHRIVSISDDFSVAVINSAGPKEPGAFHLLIRGSQLISLGRKGVGRQDAGRQRRRRNVAGRSGHRRSGPHGDVRLLIRRLRGDGVDCS